MSAQLQPAGVCDGANRSRHSNGKTAEMACSSLWTLISTYSGDSMAKWPGRQPPGPRSHKPQKYSHCSGEVVSEPMGQPTALNEQPKLRCRAAVHMQLHVQSLNATLLSLGLVLPVWPSYNTSTAAQVQ